MRKLFAALTLTAVFYQLVHGLSRGDSSVVNFFSFFTIESGILIAIVFVFPIRLAQFRSPSTLYMLTTGLGYGLLLSNLGQSATRPEPWVNVVLHLIMPMVAVTDWMLDRPKRQSALSVLNWLTFPVIYLIYTLVRGYYVEWYPYPFLDPTLRGAVVVAQTVGCFAGLMALSAELMNFLSH